MAELFNSPGNVLAPRGRVSDLIHPKALKLGFKLIRQTKKKCIRQDCQAEAPLAIRHLYDPLIRGQTAVVFTEMDKEAMVCCSKDSEKCLCLWMHETYRQSPIA